MKKTNFFKIVLTLVMAFVVTGVFAQIPADYSVYDANKTTPTNIDSVTVNSITPYYVDPDPYFHPTYDGDGSLTAGFTWTWDISTNPGTAAINSQTDNYVTISWGNTEGNYVVDVFETNGGTSCDGSITTMNTEVIAAPTKAFTGVAGYINSNINVCETDAQLNNIVGVTFTTDVVKDYSIQLNWQLEIKTLTAGGGDDKFWDDVNLATAPTSGVPVAIDHTPGSQETGINILTHDLTKPADGFISIDDGGKKTTVYTYTVTGVNDRISRKSDYLSNSAKNPALWDWYGTPESVIITVNPAPVTGPIYHISNMWAN